MDLVIRALSTAYTASFAQLKSEMKTLGNRITAKQA